MSGSTLQVWWMNWWANKAPVDQTAVGFFHKTEAINPRAQLPLVKDVAELVPHEPPEGHLDRISPPHGSRMDHTGWVQGRGNGT